MTPKIEISDTNLTSSLRAKYKIVVKLEWTRKWMAKLICETFGNNKHLSRAMDCK